MTNETFIGKNVLENLTEGMYDNPKIVYREYIQNAADSIDKAVKQGFEKQDLYIEITLDREKESISIKDNAVGIPQADFKRTLLEIANSSKDRKEDKGFRGIGRLGGLAYCKELIFKSSVKGEASCSILKWDAELMREVIHDSQQRPSAQELISKVTTCYDEEYDKETHFFEVCMVGILKEQSEELLNHHTVKDYLTQITPIPYASSFVMSQKIHKFASDNGFKIDEYKILLNGKQLEKRYSANIKSAENKTIDKMYDIQFEIIRTDDGEPIAWMWYGLTCFSEAINNINPMKGLRLRKENIQIGDASTLTANEHRFFKEDRGNNYFMGEIFVVSPELVPNSRRDYFNTDYNCRIFEIKMTNAIYQPLHDLYYFASSVKRSCKKKHEHSVAELEFKDTLFADLKDKEKKTRKLEKLREDVAKAPNNLKLRKEEALRRGGAFTRVYDNIIKKFGKEPPKSKLEPPSIGSLDGTNDEHQEEAQEATATHADKGSKKGKKQFLSQELTTLTKKEQKLVTFIYSVINEQLTATKAEALIRKIHQQLKTHP